MEYNFIKKNEVKVRLEDYMIHIIGEPGCGKTTMFYELIKEFYGDMSAGLLIPFEKGYAHLPDLQVYSGDGSDNYKIKKWKDFVKAVDELVLAKKDPNFPVKMICIDTLTEAEPIGVKRVEAIHFDETNEKKDFNACWGGYGRPNKKLAEMLKDQKDRLRDAGYGLFVISHSKTKGMKTKIKEEEYFIMSSSTGESLNAIITNDSDFVGMFVSDSVIQGRTEVKGQRKIRFRADGFYKGCKSRFSNMPEFIEPSAKAFLDAFKEAVKSASGLDEKGVKKAEESQGKVRETESQIHIQQMEVDIQKSKLEEQRAPMKDQIQEAVALMTAEWVAWINAKSLEFGCANLLVLLENGDINKVKELYDILVESKIIGGTK